MSEEVSKEGLSSMTGNVGELASEPSEVIGSSEQINVENPNRRDLSNMSGYESNVSYSDGENASVCDSETEKSVNFEREEGDGQESAPAKKVDDDEDKKNPQYIPKRGTFYEHDDRTADDIENEEDMKEEKDGKKKVWQDKKEKWNHDKFNDFEQAPKSKSELVAIYGYDIRNEDGPPKARRRRRYGRGPNKYTRNWEDVDAYGKPIVIRKPLRKPKPRNLSDNSETRDEIHEKDIEEDIVATTPIQESITQEQDRGNNRVFSDADAEKSEPIPREYKEVQSRPSAPYTQPDRIPQNIRHQRAGTGRISKPKREVLDSDYSGFTKTRQFKSSAPPRTLNKNTSDQHPNRSQGMQDIEKGLAKMNIQEEGGNYKSNARHNGNRQGSVPPRLQAEQKGSKRYSSIRQRSLPEAPNPPYQQQHNYYGNEYNQQTQTPPQQASIITNSTIHQQGAQMPPIPPPTLAPLPPQVPVTTTPILQAPPQFVPPYAPAPQFLTPGVAPASFIPPQTAPIINYGQPQYPQAPYQGFQQQFTTVNQPPELYQPQGGITYYSAQEQQAAQRSVPLKRPKAAIPIVAPPEHRGRGRSHLQVQLSHDGEAGVEFSREQLEKYDDLVETAQ